MIAALLDPDLVDGSPALVDPFDAATLQASLLVDRFALQLLSACGVCDTPAERLAHVRRALAAWPTVELAVQALARAAGLSMSLEVEPANDRAASADLAA